MKALTGSALLFLISCLIQGSEPVTMPDPVSPTFFLNVVHRSVGGDNNIWVVYTKLEVPSDYTEPLMYMAAVDQMTGDAFADCGAVKVGDDILINFGYDFGNSAFISPTDPRLASITLPLQNGPCGVTSSMEGGETGIAFKFQTFETADSTTAGDYSIYYQVEIYPSGLDGLFGTFINGEYVAPPPPTPETPITLTAPTITADLEVRDSDETSVVAAINLGDLFYLAVVITVDPYIEDLDIAGATVHTCKVATDAGITMDVTEFIDNTNCLVANGIFSTSEVDTGFRRLSASGTAPRTYVAISPALESGVVLSTTLTGVHTLYFQCVLTYCDDDSSPTPAGQCGGNHCPNHVKRRKRQVSKPDAVVNTKLEVNFNKPVTEDPTPCVESLTFKATLGTLGTTAALLFIGVIFSFSSLRRTRHKVQERKSAFESCRISGGSQNTLKSLSVSSLSSDGRGMKC